MSSPEERRLRRKRLLEPWALLFLVVGLIGALYLAIPKEAPRVEAEPFPEEAELEEILATVRRSGEFEKAEADARALRQRIESSHGKRSYPSARALDALAEILRKAGRAGESEALELATKAVSLKRDLLGPRHEQVAASLTNAGHIQRVRAKYDLAARTPKISARLTLWTTKPATADGIPTRPPIIESMPIMPIIKFSR